MKETLKPGISREVRLTVDNGRAIDFMGEEARVYATPSIVHDLEYACRNFILDHLEEGQDTVGAHVEIDHMKGTPMGEEVVHKVTVDEVDGRSITCSVEVSDRLEVVARARHKRFVVEIDRLKKAIAQKKEALAAKA